MWDNKEFPIKGRYTKIGQVDLSERKGMKEKHFYISL